MTIQLVLVCFPSSYPRGDQRRLETHPRTNWYVLPFITPLVLKLTPFRRKGNSNIIALTATLAVRVAVGPLVDRYGPRLVMAAILVLGAIPSGLAGTVTTVHGLYAVRFFIGTYPFPPLIYKQLTVSFKRHLGRNIRTLSSVDHLFLR